jgi:PAS domain S-box-containing protein
MGAALTSRSLASTYGGRSIRTLICAATAAVLLPVLFLVGWFGMQSADAERVQLEQNLYLKTREIASEVDREIVSTRSLLKALASSHFLQTGELDAFYRQASELARQQNLVIVLRDPVNDLHLFNTAVPFGAPERRAIPTERRRAELEAVRVGKAVVSDVFRGRLSKQRIVSVILPVMMNGSARYAVSLGIPAARFAQILDDAQVGAGRIAAVVSSDGVFIARSKNHPETSESLAHGHALPAGPMGIVAAKAEDGTQYHWFYRRSDLTGWILCVGIPDSALHAPARRALVGFGAMGGLLMLAAFGLTIGLGGYLVRSACALGIDRKPTREEFEVLFESSPNGVLVADSLGCIALVNAHMEKMFGHSRDELVGRPVEMLIPERIRSGHVAMRESFVRLPAAKQMGAGGEILGLRKDGSEFPIEVDLNPIWTRAGKFVMVTVVDVTARKLAAHRLMTTLAERDDLRRRFLQAQEIERLRLAHELHDQTGQSLAAMMLEMKAIESLANDRSRERLHALRGQLDALGKSLHHVAWELRPASIDELGLSTTLANYIREWSERYGIDADFYYGNSRLDDLPEELRTAIYRIIQEALTNIAKHASGATLASVVIDRGHTVLQLTIEDNGPGIDPDSPDTDRSGGGLGLPGMRERVSLLGGTLTIESSSGTAIFVRIPLAS